MLAHDMLNEEPGNPIEKLSKRELTIAQLMAQGKTFDEIAKQLHIEASTIRTYKARIFHKLEVASLHEFLAKTALYKIA
jgi:two-component system invasion response regulator UvrY